MSQQYAVKLPSDTTGTPMQDYPSAVKAKATWRQTVLASSVINLNDNTTVLEVGAFGGQGVVFRWVPSTEIASVVPAASVIASGLGVANFDHYVAQDQLRRFVVPIEVVPTSSSISNGGNNSRNGLYSRVAWAAANLSASILATEY